MNIYNHNSAYKDLDMKIAIIEPHVATRKMLYYFLTKLDYTFEISLFSCGEDYLTSYRDDDLLIMNIDLKSRVGHCIVQTLDIIGRNPAHIILLSFDYINNDIQNYVRNHCSNVEEFICKPFLKSEIHAAVLSCLQKGTQQLAVSG